MPPAYEVLLLNTAVPQIQAAQSGDTYVVPRDIAFSAALTLSAGTANGVPYLNGSKVLTTGSALTFDGTTLVSGTGIRANSYMEIRSNTSTLYWENATNTLYWAQKLTGSDFVWDYFNGTSLAEQMRLTTTGLGIGTNNPGAKLNVQSTGIQGLFQYDASNQILVFHSGSNGYVGTLTNQPLILRTNNTDRATLDTSGNLGLGVTPSNFAVVKAFQAEYATLAGNSSVNLAVNAYFNSGWKYTAAASALLYTADSGSHKWYRSTSAQVINTDPVFSAAMTLDASGNLLVGDTSNPGGRFYMKGGYARFSDGTYTGLFGKGSDLVVGGGASDLAVRSDAAILFSVGSAEKARITSGGDLLVGTQTSGGKLTVEQGNANANGAFITNQTYNYQTLGLHNTATANDNILVAFGTEASYTTRGSIQYNRGAGLIAYLTTSDYRAKDISGPVVDSGALIDSVPVYMGKMKGATQERPMFIAHETPAYAHTGVKDAVDADGKPVYQQMDASALVPVMWAEIQSLRARVAQLEQGA